MTKDIAVLPPGDFTLSLWLHVPDDRAGATGSLAAAFDPVERRGFTLSAISSAGGYSGPGDELRISFGIDDASEPTWEDCGRPSPTSNYVSNSLTVFDGALHAATSDGAAKADWGHVYRHAGGQDWEDLGKVVDTDATGIGPMVVHKGNLYAAAWSYDWTRIGDSFRRPCRVYRYVQPGRWEDCGQPGITPRIFGMTSHAGTLWTVGDDFTIQAYRGGTSWERVAEFETYGHPLTSRDGRLYVGTLDPSSLWEFNGTDWLDRGNPLGGVERCTQIHSLAWYRDRLHVGTWPLAHVARWDPVEAEWADLGRLGDAVEINALTVYNGMLYGGTIPRAEVFRYDGHGGWTTIRRIFDPSGWQPVLVADMETPPDGDRRMREWTRVTSMTEHDGRLFASIGSCTSAAFDAPADVRGSVHAMSVGTTVTSPHSLEPGWHHVAATRAGGRIAIHLDGFEVASRTGTITGPLRPDAALEVGTGPRGRYPSEMTAFELIEQALDPGQIEALAESRPSQEASA